MFRRVILCMLLGTSALSQANTKYTYDNALQLYQQGDTATAVIYLRNILSETPDNLAAQILYGQVLLQQQQFVHALEVFEGALTDGADLNLISDELSYLYLLARDPLKLQTMNRSGTMRPDKRFNWLLVSASVALQDNNVDAARQFIQQAAALNTNPVALLNAQAELAIVEKDEQSAAKWLAESQALASENVATLLQLGNLAARQERFAEAIAFYQQGLTQEPQNPLLLRAISTVQFLTGDLPAAKTALTQLAEMELNDPYLRFALPLVTALLTETKIDESILTLHADLVGMPAEYFRTEPAQLFLRGALHYLQNGEELAIKDFEEYLKLVPDDLNAIVIVADHYARTRPLGTAVKFLEEKKAFFQHHEPLLMQYVLLTLKQGRPTTAQEMLTEMRARFPDNPEMATLDAELKRQTLGPAAAMQYLTDAKVNDTPSILLTKALLAKDLQDYPQAVALAKKLLALDAGNNDYQNLYAGLLLQTGDIAAAKEYINRLTQSSPEYFPGKVTQANLFILQQNDVAASQLLTQLLQQQPQNDMLNVLLARVELRTNDAAKAEDRLLKILNRTPYRPALSLLLQYYLSVNKQQDALTLLQRALRRDFMAKDLLLAQSDIYINLGQNDLAAENIKTLLLLPDLNSNHFYELSRLQIRLNLPNDAISSLSNALKAEPKNVVYEYEIISLQIATGQLNGAEQRLQQLAQRKQTSADYYLLKALLAEARQQVRPAFEYYQQSVDVDPSFQRAWGSMYELSRQQELQQAFIDVAKKHIQQRPTDYWLQRLLAEHFINHQLFDDAAQTYTALLNANQYNNDPLLFNNLANALLLTDPATALQHAEQANQLSRNQPLILTTLAKVLMAQQLHERALSTLRQAYAQQSANPEINLLLAESLIALQRTAEARPFIEGVIQQNTSTEWVNRAKALLNTR